MSSQLQCIQYSANYEPREGDARLLCASCGEIWAEVENMSDAELYRTLDHAENDMLSYEQDPYIGPMNKEDQEEYDSLCLWLAILREEERMRNNDRADLSPGPSQEDTYEEMPCVECRYDMGYPHMDDRCADCFWEYERRRRYEFAKAFYICVLCEKPCGGYGNNPAPLKTEGLCCNACNEKVVLARLAQEKETTKN
jgi:hypothetical protein